MSALIRVGVVGIGMMGQNHVRVYSSLCDLTGIVDIDKERAKIVAKRFNTKYFDSLDELMSQNIDAVSVCTPTVTHFDIAVKFLENGIHTLIEKPICANVEAAMRLIETAESQGVVLAVGHIERHNPAVKFIKNGVKSKQWGKVILMTATRVSSYPPRVRDVGVIMDLATHDIDVMRYITDSNVESVYALGGSVLNEDREDYASILLHMDSGEDGFIETNWLTPMKSRRLTLTCTDAYVSIDYINQIVDIYTSKVLEFEEWNVFQMPQEYNIRKINLKKIEPLKLELDDFISSIKNKKKPLADGYDGLEAVKVADAIINSLKNRKKIIIGGD